MNLRSTLGSVAIALNLALATGCGSDARRAAIDPATTDEDPTGGAGNGAAGSSGQKPATNGGAGTGAAGSGAAGSGAAGSGAGAAGSGGGDAAAASGGKLDAQASPLPSDAGIATDTSKPVDATTGTSSDTATPPSPPPVAAGCQDKTAATANGVHHTTTCTLGAAASTYDITTKAPTGQRLTVRNLAATTTVLTRTGISGDTDFTTTSGMLANIIKPGMTDEAKAIAIWDYVVKSRYHFHPAEEDGDNKGDENHDPVKFLSVYGYGYCDDAAKTIAGLARAAGMTARIYGMQLHVIAEIQFAGGWHLFDADHEIYFRMADGHIGSLEELAVHPEIVTKTAVDPTGLSTSWYVTALAGKLGPQVVTYPQNHRLEPKLGPGDELVFDPSDKNLVHAVAHPIGVDGAPPTYANGRLIRKVAPVTTGPAMEMTVETAYVVLGGELRLPLTQAGASIEVAIALANGVYAPLATKVDGTTLVASLNAYFAAPRVANYLYKLRITNKGQGTLGDVATPGTLTTVFQFAPKVWPKLGAGKTTFWQKIAGENNAALPQNWGGLQVVREWDEKN